MRGMRRKGKIHYINIKFPNLIKECSILLYIIIIKHVTDYGKKNKKMNLTPSVYYLKEQNSTFANYLHHRKTFES